MTESLPPAGIGRLTRRSALVAGGAALALPRMTFIATLSIPLAVLGSIVGLYATGNTINAMTLGGLALAIGPLEDDLHRRLNR